ncbi:hypothetical protein CTM93_20040, partial [Photobacterium phosphoreum]
MFSIIIPLYNKESSLKYTVDNAIIAFSSFIYEIIIIDDGSTDESLNIALELSENNNCITVISKENGGVSSARNLGIKKAEYEYIVFLDADDNLLPHTGREYIDLINYCDNNVGMYCVGFEVVSENKKNAFNSQKYLKAKDWFGVIDNPLRVLCIDKNSTFMCASSICVKKSVLEYHNISFPLGITHTEDTSFFYDLILKTKIAYSSRVCCSYQLDALNRTNTSKPTKTRYIIDKILFLMEKREVLGTNK